MDNKKELIESLNDYEIKEAVKLGDTDFEPGIYDLCIEEARKRGINITEIKSKVEKENHYPYAPLWKRLINYSVDTLLTLYLIAFITSNPVKEGLLNPVFAFFLCLLVYLTYFIIFEFKFSRTLGKYLTGTYVVNTDMSKPDIETIIKRSLSRLIPFNHLVTLFSGKSIHQRTSGTMCLEIRRK